MTVGDGVRSFRNDRVDVVKDLGTDAARLASRVVQDETAAEEESAFGLVMDRGRTNRAGRFLVVVTLESSFSGDLHSVRTSPSAHMAKTGVKDKSACSAA